MSILFQHESFLVLSSVNNTGIRLMIDTLPKDLDEVGKILKNYDIKTVVIGHTYKGSIDWIVKYLPNIEEMRVLSSDAAVDGINDLNKLQVLRLDTHKKFNLDFHSLDSLVFLEVVWQDSLNDSFQTKSNLIALRILSPKSQNLNFLKHQSQIEELALSKANKLESLEGIENITNLNFLNIASSKSLTELSSIGGHTSLCYLSINSCNKISEIPVMAKVGIKELLLDCKSISSLKPLDTWDKLEKIVFTAHVEDNDIAVLKTKDSLKFVSFSNRKTYNLKEKDISQYLENKGFNKENNGLMKSLRTIESYRL